MSSIVLTPAQLEEKKSELASLSRRLDSQISDLQSIISILRTVWEGDAADAFQTRGHEEIRRLADMRDVFNSYIVALDKTIAQYKDTERNNVALANG